MRPQCLEVHALMHRLREDLCPQVAHSLTGWETSGLLHSVTEGKGLHMDLSGQRKKQKSGHCLPKCFSQLTRWLRYPEGKK